MNPDGIDKENQDDQVTISNKYIYTAAEEKYGVTTADKCNKSDERH